MRTREPKYNLTPGQHYNVKVRNLVDLNTQKVGRSVRRIFKRTETRFRSIPCYVFTSKVSPRLTATWHEDTKTLSLSLVGRGYFPASELSVPEYDIVSCEPA